jgi:hypothetical protein
MKTNSMVRTRPNIRETIVPEAITAVALSKRRPPAAGTVSGS